MSDADFTQDQDSWEEAVFRNADHFTSVLFLGRGQYDTKTFATLPEAIAASPLVTNARGRLVYCVSKSGRRLCIDRDKREHWLKLWEKYHAHAHL